MNEMTKQEAIENHRKMWNWIADKTLELERKVQKKEYFEAMGMTMSEKPIYGCYCCEYTNRTCGLCPIEWPNIVGGKEVISTCTSSLYRLWWLSPSYKDAAKYARDIAELPEKEWPFICI